MNGDSLMPGARQGRHSSPRECRNCGADTRPGVVVTIRVDGVDENGKRKHSGTRGRTFCPKCAPYVVEDMLSELERLA